MTITKAKYHKDDNNNNTSVYTTINGVKYSVPMDEDNTHYQEILKWVEEGNTIEEAD